MVVGEEEEEEQEEQEDQEEQEERRRRYRIRRDRVKARDEVTVGEVDRVAATKPRASLPQGRGGRGEGRAGGGG